MPYLHPLDVYKRQEVDYVVCDLNAYTSRATFGVTCAGFMCCKKSKVFS